MFGFFKKYHFVPQCPRCGSWKTGRYIYVQNTRDCIEKMVAEHYEKGEITRIRMGFYSSDVPNIFCENCGVEWRGKIDELPLTKDRIKEERIRREITTEKYNNMLNHKEIIKNQRLAEKKQRKQEKKMMKQELKRKKKKLKNQKQGKK